MDDETKLKGLKLQFDELRLRLDGATEPDERVAILEMLSTVKQLTEELRAKISKESS